ncbi:hypothetical protein D9V34_00750 [Mycetocola lacteus]|uniref:ESX-1 secretion-associated protein n=1 Tax=Mycetocola lacteus TaxID=76637 RepID=A0A3L7AYF8_9MICO|nr:hypothetical protein [Mycetocola lacteus]RLP80776.1 hypothetical protein D9V34_13045 [Mycetocola lacteus]RLP84561.1 hypothetical protein D9V34_00750 [Mycetocola lacteus]
MSDKIALDMSMLRAHASRIDQVASDVGEAAAAARSMNVAGGAFGLMCSFLVPPALVAVTSMERMLSASQRAIEHTATQLREIADEAEQREEDNIALIRELERGLPR